MNLFKRRQEQLNIFHKYRKQQKPSVEIPDRSFVTCEQCHSTFVKQDIERNDNVCPVCGHHFTMHVRQRIEHLCDAGSFKEIDKNWITKNVEFPDYDQKLNRAKNKSGLKEAVVCGLARIESIPCAIGIMDSAFMMGSMGTVVGEKITRLIELADRKKLPLILCCTSGGARMQEGIRSLVQMAKTVAALKQFNNHGGLYSSLLTNPTTGGVSASFAMLADIILSEPDCLIGFAGRRVIENTTHEQLPDSFQKAEFMLEKGFIDAIVVRRDCKRQIANLLRIHGA